MLSAKSGNKGPEKIPKTMLITMYGYLSKNGLVQTTPNIFTRPFQNVSKAKLTNFKNHQTLKEKDYAENHSL